MIYFIDIEEANPLDLDADEQEIGVCCADFYNHPIIVKLLDGIFHPGGLALSKLMVDRLGLTSNDTLLDIACGDGNTASYLAKKMGIQVSGIDVGEGMIETAIKRSKSMRVEDQTDFRVALASKIPYEANSFNAIISECALCTFVDKDAALLEIIRVLKPNGIVGLNDVTVQDQDALDEELRGLLGKVACVADALSSKGYVDLFSRYGFKPISSSVHSNLLGDMACKAKTRARFFRDVGEEQETNSKMDEAVRLIGMIEKQIESGNIGYEMFIFQAK
ncbi:MAG: class I SAM-dependent methyltransferase [Candidatus Thorarchaeota archaeon]|nr:MAG: class I SAM-dependent methyltransferase [Candidatus Thorarchaeota archaeon]